MAKLFFACSEIKFPFIISLPFFFFFFVPTEMPRFSWDAYRAGTVLPVFVKRGQDSQLNMWVCGFCVMLSCCKSPKKLLAFRKHVLPMVTIALPKDSKL